MFIGDRDRSLDALGSAADLDIASGLGLQFTAIYAMRLRKRLDAGTLLRRHLVDVTIKNHSNGVRNPYAQHRQELTAADVEESRPISDALTLLMCSSMSDGAAAAVLGPMDGRRRSGRPRIRIRASQSGGH